MPKATLRPIGMLNTLTHMEAFLDTLRGRSAATSNDGTGLIVSKVVPPKREGNDPMVMELWCVANLGHCILEIPEGSPVDEVEDSPVGPYTHVRVGGRPSGVSVHLHKGMVGDDALVVSGNARLCIRTFHPEGADTRQGGRQAWKNYNLFIDFTPYEGEAADKADHRILILDPGHPLYQPRSEALLLGEGDSNEWATRSQDWDPAKGRGINQHIRVVVFDPETLGDTADGAAVSANGVVSTPPARSSQTRPGPGTSGATLRERLAAQGVSVPTSGA